ncbi:MAG: ABC transporter ATP-binding protein [Anaerolineales bacterium]|nr:ABC transporter ATP-binding protein [Anaerolineales bacterium]
MKRRNLLTHYLGQQRPRVLLLAFLLLVAIGLQLANPQVVRFFIDTAENQSGVERLLGAAAIFVTVSIIRQLFNLASIYVGENVAWIATNQLRADLAAHILKLDMSFHKAHKPGELIERVDGDVNQLANYFSRLVIQLGMNLLLIGGILVLLWGLHWSLGLIITVIVILAYIYVHLINPRVVAAYGRVRAAEANLFGALEEWLGGTETLRANGGEAYVMDRLYRLLRQRYQADMRARWTSQLIVRMPPMVFLFSYITAYVLGSTLLAESSLTIGSLYLIFYYIDLIRDPLWKIRRQLEELQKAAASIERINELFQIESTVLDGPGAALPAGPLTVQFNQVDFAYADDPDTAILQQISFALQPGKVLGLLGRTGSGKSTLTKLLFRFYDPTSGQIQLGNGELHDLRQASLAQLRHHIGLVTQEIELFQASVRDNLTLFDDTIPDERISAVLTELGLDGWLANLEHGLDTQLSTGSGGRGGGLSAGEAQLLAFTRVFLRDPGLVILDEASSRLDPATEQLIERAIDKLLADRTAIIIAHRLATVQRSDEIMILDAGRIIEHGDRAALVADPNSHFYGLLQTGLEEAFA